MKKAILILGVNGSGKTTFYKKYLKNDFVKEDIFYINADEIKQQLVNDGIENNQAKIKSGHFAVSQMNKLSKENKDFAFETTFTDNGNTGSVAIIKELKSQGYKIEGYFIHTKDVDENINRVFNRFATNTGHFVPADIIKQRYDLCVNNVKEHLCLFDKFYFIDNTNLDFKISNESLIGLNCKNMIINIPEHTNNSQNEMEKTNYSLLNYINIRDLYDILTNTIKGKSISNEKKDFIRKEEENHKDNSVSYQYRTL